MMYTDITSSSEENFLPSQSVKRLSKHVKWFRNIALSIPSSKHNSKPRNKFGPQMVN